MSSGFWPFFFLLLWPLPWLFFISPGVQPINLVDPTQNYDNVEAVLTGWGYISYSGPHIPPIDPDILQKVSLRTMSNEVCQNIVRRIPQHKTTVIKDYQICTEELPKAACHGDSGGPLVVRNQYGKYSLLGLVSFGTTPGKCARSPDVYTRVSYFSEWIEKNKVP